jgi:hypothetical protein
VAIDLIITFKVTNCLICLVNCGLLLVYHHTYFNEEIDKIGIYADIHGSISIMCSFSDQSLLEGFAFCGRGLKRHNVFFIIIIYVSFSVNMN